MIRQKFVAAYRRFAEQSQEKTGIDARFTLAQAALESGWGRSAPGNMFFGVKANPATVSANKRQLLLTSEVMSDEHQSARFPKVVSITKRPDGKFLYRVWDWFRKYDTPEECFTDHAALFHNNKRYAKALEVRHDPYLFAAEIAEAGYATAPDYAKTLHRMINQINELL